jgi:hypothetical protein
MKIWKPGARVRGPKSSDQFGWQRAEATTERFSMLSIVDTTHDKKVADIQIDGDTLKAMALATSSSLLYVNNSAKNWIDVVNRRTRKVVATWPVTACKRNLAIALDESSHRLFTACRSGAIDVFETQTGKELQCLCRFHRESMI